MAYYGQQYQQGYQQQPPQMGQHQQYVDQRYQNYGQQSTCYGSYGSYYQQNVFQQSAWQAFQFSSEQDLWNIFSAEMSKNPANAERQAIQAEDLCNILNTCQTIQRYFNSYQISPKCVETLLKRYSRVVCHRGPPKPLIAFDDFTAVSVKIRALTDAFRKRDQMQHGNEQGNCLLTYDDRYQPDVYFKEFEGTLEHLKSTHYSRVHSIKAFDFSTLYTTVPHSRLKERLAKHISNAFTSKNGNRKYKFIVVNYDKTYVVKEKSDSENKYTETDIIQMLNFLINNIFVVFGGKVFQQIVGIPMGTNCAPLLIDIFLYSYEAEFIQSLVSEGKRYLASDLNFTYRYIDDVLSINNQKFADYQSRIYPSELEIKETTDTNNSASYLDIMLSHDTDGHMNTSL
ncbi:hypothetical protein FSP39_016181 [Pinctada imbricata]|uniref:Reverse transcriptase domain-containing protein n=1 Tax=Pinctada imbricata TaxID=66713 RepID=A0AA89CBX3_PINIB|nr:hypothetical protein FSP39_016181 [Pinctada imbricata]